MLAGEYVSGKVGLFYVCSRFCGFLTFERPWSLPRFSLSRQYVSGNDVSGKDASGKDACGKDISGKR